MNYLKRRIRKLQSLGSRVWQLWIVNGWLATWYHACHDHGGVGLHMYSQAMSYMNGIIVPIN